MFFYGRDRYHAPDQSGLVGVPAGLILVAVLAVVGLIGAALLTSVFLIPALYLIYLYHTRVIQDAPASVVGVTFAGGIVLAIALQVGLRFTAPWLGEIDMPIANRLVAGLALGGFAIPLLQEMIKAVAPLLLWRNDRFPHTICHVRTAMTT